MSDLQRQHPVAAITKALDIIRDNFITILVLLFIGGGNQSSFTLYWIAGTIVFLLVWGVISWLRFQFKVEDGELYIEQGVIIHKKLYLASDRIQVIDISAGVVQRMFGLVEVQVKTAGSTSKQAKISALSRQKAEQLKALLRVEQQEQSAEEEPGPQEVQKCYTFSRRDLLIAATTSGRMGVALSIVGAGFSQLDQLIAEDQIYRFIETHIPQSTSATLILLSAIAVLGVSWLLSFVSTIIAYYDFEVEIRERELLISRGLFERTQLTIPFNRIQAIQIKEELARQPFGYVSLVIESAGYGKKKGNSTTLFPLIKKEQMYQFLEEVVPEYSYHIGEPDIHPPRRSLRRYLLRAVWWTLPLVAVLWMSIPYGVYAWFLLLPALLLGYFQYSDAGMRREDSTLILSSRLLSKTTAVIKKYRMQATLLKQNPFQSRLQLQDFTIHVASGNQGRSFTVRDLDEEDSDQCWDWMRYHEQKQAVLLPEPPPDGETAGRKPD